MCKFTAKHTLLTLLLSLVTLIQVAAQTSRSEYNGAWTDNNSWIGNAPATTLGKDAVVVINGTIILDGALDLQKNSSLTINDGDTLVITGNFNAAKECTFTIGAGASFIVLGDFTSAKSPTVQNDGVLLIAGAVSVTKDPNVTNNGYIYTNDPATSNEQFGVTGGTAEETLPIDQLSTGTPEEQNLYEYVTSGGTTILPVEVAYFKALLNRQNATMSWATEMELNFDYFEILHSTDNENWQVAGTVRGHGNSNDFRTYSFTHESPQAGRNFYALKAVDFDGTFEMHGVVEVNKLSKLHNLTVFPNPVRNNKVKLKDFDPTEGELSVQIRNSAGRLVYTETVKGLSDQLDFSSEFASGIYTMIITQGSQKIYRKLMID